MFVVDHYKSIAANYDALHSHYHMYDDIADMICGWLSLLPTDNVADIGAGTGGVSSLVWKKAGIYILLH